MKRFFPLPFLVTLCLLAFLAATPSVASADWFDKIGSKLDEVSATLDKLSAVLDAGIAGPSPEATQVIENAQGKTPTVDAFVGKWEESWELNAGQATHEEFKKNPGFVTDRNMLSRLGTVAQRLVKNVDRKNLDYHFAILKSDDLNAFAAPGGYIYVTEGLMKAIGSDDELAGVLAHELGHVQKKHSVRAMEKNAAMVAVVASLASWKKTRKYSWVGALAAFFAKQAFSREDEFEADAVAVDLTLKSGYNPRGLLQFFDRINTNDKTAKYTKYISTHPPTQDRIKRVEALIAEKAPQYANRGAAPAVTTQTPATTTTTTTTGGGAVPTNNSPFPTQGGSTTTSTTNPAPGSTTTSTTPAPTAGRQPTSQELRQAYEVYLFYKEQYEFAVQRKAPIDEIMAAYKNYNAARDYYVALRRAAGLPN